ncbi:MAG: AhpC/TSA family protein [Crocinitomicaceae bacterium]|nr:AhpC/TSA family protein [Crocinitomicaceae bacterium]
MKYFFGVICSAFLLIGCGESTPHESTDNQEQISPIMGNKFKIVGTIKGANNEKVLLQKMTAGTISDVIEAKTNIDGVFELSADISEFGYYQLSVGNQMDKNIPLTLIPGDNITLDTEFSTFNTTPKLKGSTWTNALSEYLEIVSTFQEDQKKLMLLKGKISDEELTESFLRIKKPVDDYALNQMKVSPENPVNILLSSSATPYAGFEKWNSENLEILKAVSDAYTKTYPTSELTKIMVDQTAQIESSYTIYVMNNSGTIEAPEINLENPDGQQIALSSLRGKYVLIDFWASWCRPCRQENPSVVRLYNKYKDQGFTVYSVSLDRNKEAWKTAIERDGLIWPNHVSDLLEWKTPMLQLYGFSSIPHTVLIDKEGIIIGTKLRGTSLEQKLEEIFSK